MKSDRCDVPNCSHESVLTWRGYNICAHHWMMHTDETKRFNLHKVFGIEVKTSGASETDQP